MNNPPSGWNGYKGFINADIIKKEVPDFSKRTFYICGPPGMVNAMKKLLEELGAWEGIPGDIDNDGKVDLADWAILSSHWLEETDG